MVAGTDAGANPSPHPGPLPQAGEGAGTGKGTGEAQAHDAWAMRLAIDQALNAELVGEVPVGAVLVRRVNGAMQVLATGYNRPITTHDPTAHAELVALRHAAQLVENYRLPGCELFVTLEPCAMCAMALMHARLSRVVFGAHDPKTGAAGSVVNLFAEPRLNHHTELRGGEQEAACGDLLRRFFAARRADAAAAKRAAQASSDANAPDLIPTAEVSELAADPDPGPPGTAHPHP
jgi:tRNA(adenine34) deaminase